MPIRQRSGNWQADIRLPNGHRIRKQFPTKAAAQAFERSIRPQKRREAPLQPSSRRTPKPATRKTASRGKSSPRNMATSSRKTSQRARSRQSVTNGGTSSPPRGGTTTVH